MEWPITLAAITLVTLLILSVPIGVAIGSSVVVAVMVGDLPAEFLMQKLVLSLDSFPLLAVPFFVLSGEIMQKGSMAQSLLAFSKCLGSGLIIPNEVKTGYTEDMEVSHAYPVLPFRKPDGTDQPFLSPLSRYPPCR